jgi:hypothetical protein
MSDTGIYWQSGTYAGWHIYPQALWGMGFRSAATDCGLQLRRSDNTSLGAVYSDGTSIGFLTAAFGWGASWTLAGEMNRGSVPGSLVTGNISGNAATATLATKASTLSQGGGNGTGMTFNWSGQSGQPTWLWGSNDGTNIYVWNPSNFNVNSATTATTATNAGCITSDTGNVGESRLQYWQTSGNTTLNPDGEWYNAIRMGHGNPVTYYSNTLAVRMTGGNLGDIYTRTTTNGNTGSWNRFWHNNNDGAGSGLDADLVDGKGLAIAATADTIVLRDSSGHITGQYILGSYFNASAGNGENPTIGQIWTQNTSDNYLRKSTPAHFRSQVTDGSYPSLTGANASGTWSISVTGNAATATTATTANNAVVNSGNTSAAWYPIVWHSGNTLYSTAGVTLYAGGSYIQTAYFNSSDDVSSGNISHIVAKFGDNYHRSATAAKVAAFISGQTMNIVGSATSLNTGNTYQVASLGVSVAASNRLHVNGDGTNPAIRVDNTGVVLAATVGSNGRTFYGWLPVSVDGTTRWIRIFS